MKFEEWAFNHEVSSACDYSGREVIEFMRQAWNAAKQDSNSFVPSAYIVAPYVSEFYEEKDYQVVCDSTGSTLVWCKTEENCKLWMLQNGYRLK